MGFQPVWRVLASHRRAEAFDDPEVR